MAVKNLRDWALGVSSKGLETQISQLAKESGILSTMLFQPANHGLFHKYKLAENLASGGFRAINGSIVPSKVTQKVQQEDLKLLTDLQRLDKGYCETYPGGANSAFAEDSPQFVEGLGQKAATQFIYGINGSGDEEGFAGLRDLAVANNKTISQGGAEGSSTTILCVKWRKDETTGLFNPANFNKGKIVNIEMENNGKWFMETTNTSTGAVKPVYGALYESYLSLLMSNPNNVFAYTNIQDADGFKPTSANMDKMIASVKAKPSDTIIYMNWTALRLLQELKVGKLQISTTDTDYSKWLISWNGIPIVLEENLTDTESYS